MARWVLALALVLSVSLAIGCGKKAPSEASGSTAEEAALAFAKALADGDTKTAASYWAYDAQARADNEDWDAIPPGQRNEIKSKLRESKATELASSVSAFKGATGELKAQTQGNVVTISGDSGSIAQIQVESGEGGYKIAAVQTAG